MAGRRRLVVFLVLAVAIPVCLSAEYWAFGRLSVFRLDNANAFFFPELQEVAATGGVPTWSPLMGGGVLTRPQSMKTLNPLPQLTRLVGPIAAYKVFYLLALSVASVCTFVLMKDTVDRGALFGVAAAYIYANISFEQLAIAPEYVVFMLTPLVLWVFIRIVPEPGSPVTKMVVVVALGVVVGFVGDYSRNTIWMVTGFTPIVLLFPRPFRWSTVGWWGLFVLLTTAFAVREIYAIAVFNAWSDRAYFRKFDSASTAGLMVEWATNLYQLAREQGGFLTVSLIFVAVTTYLAERDLRRRVVRHILLAVGLLVVMDLMVWLAAWGLQDVGGPVARSLTMRMQTVLWAYAPLAALMIAGYLPRGLGITAGSRWIMSLSTAVVIVMLMSSGWTHASRVKTNIGAWLNNRTVGFFLDYEPLRRLRVEDPSVFRVAAVQSGRPAETDLKPGHLLYYGFETSDSLFSNQIHLVRQFWGMVLNEPGFRPSMSLYVVAPEEAGGIHLEERLRLPLLSLMNTKYFVSREPIVSRSSRIVPVHTPGASPAAGVVAAIRRNFTGGDFSIYRNLDAFDRVFLVAGVRGFADERALLDALGAASTAELRESVFVVERDAARLRGLEHDAEARVTLDRYAGSVLEMSVRTRAPVALVISNAFGPWWRCGSGAGALETFAAYHAWLGVRLDAGEHRVECFIDASRFDPFGTHG